MTRQDKEGWNWVGYFVRVKWASPGLWNVRVWPKFYIGSHALIMVFGRSQSNEVSMFSGDDGSVSSDCPQDIQKFDCTIQVFWSFRAWVMHSCTPQKYRAAIIIFISFYIKIQICTTFQCSPIRVALIQYEKCYTSCPVWAMPSVCVQVHLQIKLTTVSV